MVLFTQANKLVNGFIKGFREINQFNVRNKALAGFDSLYCVFVHIQPKNLEGICKLPLRHSGFLSEFGNLFA